MTHTYHRFIAMWGAIFCLPFFTEYLAYSFAVYLVLSLTVTVGYHRLFNHQSFRCSPFWHYLFGILGCIGLNSSPVAWSLVHSNHHRHADTEKDPYSKSWLSFFRLRDRKDLEHSRKEITLLRQPFHRFLNSYSLIISLSYAAVTMHLLGYQGLVYGYLLPVGMAVLASTAHTVFSHSATKARDLPIMEFLIPFFGEWLHARHHANPQITNFSPNHNRYLLDVGHLFISAIRTRQPQP
jgi:stearoyl-CoA desaturase (delta-9 desaturase)